MESNGSFSILISNSITNTASISTGEGTIAALSMAVTATDNYGVLIPLNPTRVSIQDTNGLSLLVNAVAGTFS